VRALNGQVDAVVGHGACDLGAQREVGADVVEAGWRRIVGMTLAQQAADSGGVSVDNAATQDDVDSANLLGIIGIVVGTVSLLVGGFALFRRRST
jgi:hypothetical protein